ncbi:MAG TPA: TIGR04076 family protein [Syntrophorhabdaceae bacterium]|nr:TIGR04076 family protein [Syntrophorhabdaceae bacterium]
MKKFRVEIERVNGYCSHGYKTGDVFVFNGLNTPDSFCGGAYTTLFPVIFALGSGSRFEYEKDPRCKTGMACPDNGNVVFSVGLLDVEF